VSCTSSEIPKSSGLYYIDDVSNTRQILPLKNITYNVYIEDSIARVEIIQYYHNDRPNTIETEYNFPISDKAVFDKFSAMIDDKVLIGKILKKDEAKKIYTEEKSRGSTVAYSEITSGVDVMQIKVGNVNRNDVIQIKFSYIEPLDVYLNTFWRFKIYSTVNPRYAPSHNQANVNIINTNSLLYPWFVNVKVKTTNPIKTLEVPSHDNVVVKDVLNANEVILEFNSDSLVYPNKDYELYFNTQDDFTPKVILEQHPIDKDSYIGMVNFFPKFNEILEDSLLIQIRKFLSIEGDSNTFNDSTAINSPTNMENDIKNAKAEFIFILDRSGSMTGDKMDQLKNTMKSLIRLLPEQSYFNIYSFGSDYKTMFSYSVLASEYKYEAIANLNSFEANYGGTEILKPISAAINSKQLEGFPKVIYLLTDGEVSNSDEIIKLVKKSTNKARVFSVGIGSGISPYFIKNVGLRGEGGYEFVKDSNHLEEKTKQMLFKMISPSLSKFKINFSPSQALSFSRPDIEKIPYLVKNEPFKFFFFLDKETFAYNKSMNVKINLDMSYLNSYSDAMQNYKIEINRNDAISDDKLHKLAYKSIIDDNKFENKLTDSQIVDISLKYQVLCDKTAFILVLKRSESNEKNVVETIEIPNQSQGQIEMASADVQYTAKSASAASSSGGAYYSPQANIAYTANGSSGSYFSRQWILLLIFLISLFFM